MRKINTKRELNFTHLLSEEDNHKVNHKLNQLNSIKNLSHNEKVFEYVRFMLDNFDSTVASEICTNSIQAISK